MKKLIEKIRRFIDKVRYNFSRQSCYDEMEKRGIAIFGMCGGTVGGDKYTNSLSYSCIDCPYYVGFGKEQT